MLKQHLGSLPPSAGPDAGYVSFELSRRDVALRQDADQGLEEVSAPADDGTRDELAREIAEIEAATAALRRAEPALESWTNAPPAAPAAKPRPVWLLIGVLWLSSALVTAIAVGAIVTFAG